MCHIHPRLRRFALFAAVLLWSSLAGAAAPSAPVLLVVGDSISAGYGLPPDTGWAHLLASRLRRESLPDRVVNASISGDTTAGGRARLPALLTQHHPGIVVIELGGNDGLRG
ncbi:MAG: GDSL-type esterase/lipase family protein, partial [Betaproteobacteria bacterium]